MNQLPEAVNQQFNQLFAAISHAADDCKIESAEASLVGDFASVTARMEDCKRLQTLDMELRACLKRFGERQPSKAVIRPVRTHTNAVKLSLTYRPCGVLGRRGTEALALFGRVV
jgi:hypothetical protein